MKLTINCRNAVLVLQSKGNILKIEVDFLPSSHPDFTDFLDSVYGLQKVHNNEDRQSGYYILYVEDAKFNGILLSTITNGADLYVKSVQMPQTHAK